MESSKQSVVFGNSIMDTLNSHNNKFHTLEGLYLEASKLITRFDEFCTKERKTLADYENLLIDNDLKKGEIVKHIHFINSSMKRFEKTQENLRDNLQDKSEQIFTEDPTAKDRKDENKKKINGFSSAFLGIHTDVETLLSTFEQINRVV